jgi:hypothetical protein
MIDARMFPRTGRDRGQAVESGTSNIPYNRSMLQAHPSLELKKKSQHHPSILL